MFEKFLNNSYLFNCMLLTNNMTYADMVLDAPLIWKIAPLGGDTVE